MAHTSPAGRFPDRAQADDAVKALLAAGFPAEAISLSESGSGHEGRFLGRIVILIVLWSIPGGALGAALGALLSITGIGPQGTTGVVVQVVSWLIIGHLLAGMWAGYVLLADRSHREMAPDRESGVTISVNCRTEAETEAARRLLGPSQ
ncbi:MAG TPA: hypothetical protein VFP63_09340 [Dehalococcoidia bacterium]|nr:hypothetical protein [Dehalococcoidia bacterium]